MHKPSAFYLFYVEKEVKVNERYKNSFFLISSYVLMKISFNYLV